MNELLTLIKCGLFDTFSTSNKDKKTKRRIFTIIIAIVLAMPSFVYIVWQLAEVFEAINQLDLLIYMAIILITTSTFVTSIIKASGFLFNFKDFDLLTSLPISNSSILLSKLSLLMLNSMFSTIPIALLFCIIYGIFAEMGTGFFVITVLLSPFLSVFPTLLGSVFSILVSWISSKLKTDLIFQYVGYILLVSGVFVLQYYINQLVASQSAPTYFQTLVGYYPIGVYFFNSIIDISPVNIFMYFITNFAVLSVFVLVFSRQFKKINGLLNEKHSTANYRLKSMQISGVLASLYKREIKSYFGSAIYVLNTAFGMLFYLIYPAAILIFGGEAVMAVLEIPYASDFVLPISLIIAVFVLSMSTTTGSTISLEGKMLWVLKSIPVSFKQISLAKILLNLTITIPCFVIGSATLAIIMNYSFMSTLLFFWAGLSFAILFPVIGLLVNLKFPKLEWKSQINVVKQSMSIMICVFGGMILASLLAAVYFILKPDFSLFCIVSALITDIIIYVLWRITNNWGRTTFEKL